MEKACSSKDVSGAASFHAKLCATGLGRLDIEAPTGIEAPANIPIPQQQQAQQQQAQQPTQQAQEQAPNVPGDALAGIMGNSLPNANPVPNAVANPVGNPTAKPATRSILMVPAKTATAAPVSWAVANDPLYQIPAGSGDSSEAIASLQTSKQDSLKPAAGKNGKLIIVQNSSLRLLSFLFFISVL